MVVRGSGGAQVPSWQETCQGSTLGNVALAGGHQGKAGMEAGGRVMESGRARWRERSDCGRTDDISPRPIGPTVQLQCLDFFSHQQRPRSCSQGRCIPKSEKEKENHSFQHFLRTFCPPSLQKLEEMLSL